MRFAFFVVALFLQVFPAVAFAEWHLTVTDTKTREVRTFSPPADAVFPVAMDIGGWKCRTTGENTESGVARMYLACAFRDARMMVGVDKGQKGGLLVLLTGKRGAVFGVGLWAN